MNDNAGSSGTDGPPACVNVTGVLAGLEPSLAREHLRDSADSAHTANVIHGGSGIVEVCLGRSADPQFYRLQLPLPVRQRHASSQQAGQSLEDPLGESMQRVTVLAFWPHGSSSTADSLADDMHPIMSVITLPLRGEPGNWGTT